MILLYVVVEWTPVVDPLVGFGRFYGSVLSLAVILLGLLIYRRVSEVTFIEIASFMVLSAGWFVMHSLSLLLGVERVLEISLTDKGDILLYSGLALSIAFFVFILRLLSLKPSSENRN